MVSYNAIDLATRNRLTPEFIFNNSIYDKPVSDLLDLIRSRSCSAADLINAGFGCRDFMKELELELEAFEYWKEVNFALVVFWDAGNKMVFPLGNLDRARLGAERVQMLIEKVKQVFVELKKVQINF